MPLRSLRFTSTAAVLAAMASVLMAHQPAHAAADRIRLGSTADVSRSAWNGPAFTRTGAGADTYYLDMEAYSGSGSATYTCNVTKS